MLSEQPDLVPYDREPVTDDEARQFIREQLHVDPKLKHTPLLRKLRDGGRACEQSRFARLYREVVEQMHGNP